MDRSPPLVPRFLPVSFLTLSPILILLLGLEPVALEPYFPILPPRSGVLGLAATSSMATRVFFEESDLFLKVIPQLTPLVNYFHM
jgi:hypothetical protein